MDFKMQNNQQPQTQPASSRAAANQAPNGDGGRKVVAIAISVFVALVLLLGAVLLWQGMGNKSTASSEGSIDKSGYQALFMTNGQVYFGHLTNIDGSYAQLTDVYYLQVQQAVQPAAEKKDSEQPKVSLTKLGNELHGPKDEMHISKEQILFWENLKDDSTVVKAIKDYRAKQ